MKFVGFRPYEKGKDLKQYGPKDSIWDHKSYKNHKDKITLSLRGVKILQPPFGLLSVVIISSII